MDRNGIGTDATIANHIKTIQTREYAIKNGAGNFIPTDLGLALVEGYNSMGLKLNKPYLRAAMEADCQKIVRGETNKITVVAACLKEMELRFRQAQEQASKLDVAVAKYFGGVGDEDISTYNIIRTNFSTCGTCNGKMDLRSENENNDDEATMFLYCMSCKKGMKLPRGELQPFDGRCAICNFQVCVV
jgi:DNA topoisomerase-3